MDSDANNEIIAIARINGKIPFWILELQIEFCTAMLHQTITCVQGILHSRHSSLIAQSHERIFRRITQRIF